MTTTELVDLVTGFKWFRDRKIKIDEGEVWLGANQAQTEILAELHPIDDVGQLATNPSQERYAFTKGTILGATNVNPIVIEQTGHPYHTGDLVAISGVLGNTAANGRHSVTYVDANHYSLPVAGNGAWTSGGFSYHCLMGAVRIASDMMNLTTFGLIKPRRYDWIQSNRGVMLDGNPQYYYQMSTPTGLMIGIIGKPSVNSTMEFRYYRTTLPHEKISATVDPWIPDDYDHCLIHGTLYFILNQLKSSGDKVVEEKEQELRGQYEEDKAQLRMGEAKKRFVADIDSSFLRF
jgi:hypothetical protein